MGLDCPHVSWSSSAVLKVAEISAANTVEENIYQLTKRKNKKNLFDRKGRKMSEFRLLAKLAALKNLFNKVLPADNNLPVSHPARGMYGPVCLYILNKLDHFFLAFFLLLGGPHLASPPIHHRDTTRAHVQRCAFGAT